MPLKLPFLHVFFPLLCKQEIVSPPSLVPRLFSSGPSSVLGLLFWALTLSQYSAASGGEEAGPLVEAASAGPWAEKIRPHLVMFSDLLLHILFSFTWPVSSWPYLSCRLQHWQHFCGTLMMLCSQHSLELNSALRVSNI